MSYLVCKFPSWFLTLKPTSKLWALRPIGVGCGQNGIPWQEITSSVWNFGDVFFLHKKCGDSNLNWADVGNKDKQKKHGKLYMLFLLVLDLIV